MRFNRMLSGGLAAVLCMVSMSAMAEESEDGVNRPSPRSGFYVGFANKETGFAELGWQLMNVIDVMQTAQIAKNPKCFQEVGQLAIFTGNHPSTKQVYLISGGLFAVSHYVIAKGLDHLVTQNPDYMVLQRVYQYVGSGYKAYTIANNASIGLGLDHSRDCVR